MRNRPSPAVSRGASPARVAALDILERVALSDAHSDDLLHSSRMTALSQVDRDLATTLVLGVLRWQIALDAQVSRLLSRPDAQLATPVAIALRLGAFQLLHTDRIPPHAVLFESVELVRAAGHAHAAGMVNAILRKLTAAPPLRRPLAETPAALAERLGHPLWLVSRWIQSYGRSAAEAICAFDQAQPGCGSVLPEDAGMPVMDAGSRLVAEIAAASARSATRVWDCCAAPGGKTLVLAQRLPQAELLATDASAPRLQRLRQRLERTVPERVVRTIIADAATPQPALGTFELILCDVPCSGTGTLARNPEIRHRLQPADLRRQAKRQMEILRRTLERLAPGGRLVYSSCSLEPEENEQVVEAVLAETPSVRVVPVEAVFRQMESEGLLRLPGEALRGLVRQGALRTLPGYGFEGDGFFATVLERDVGPA